MSNDPISVLLQRFRGRTVKDQTKKLKWWKEFNSSVSSQQTNNTMDNICINLDNKKIFNGFINTLNDLSRVKKPFSTKNSEKSYNLFGCLHLIQITSDCEHKNAQKKLIDSIQKAAAKFKNDSESMECIVAWIRNYIKNNNNATHILLPYLSCLGSLLIDNVLNNNFDFLLQRSSIEQCKILLEYMDWETLHDLSSFIRDIAKLINNCGDYYMQFLLLKWISTYYINCCIVLKEDTSRIKKDKQIVFLNDIISDFYECIDDLDLDNVNEIWCNTFKDKLNDKLFGDINHDDDIHDILHEYNNQIHPQNTVWSVINVDKLYINDDVYDIINIQTGSKLLYIQYDSNKNSNISLTWNGVSYFRSDSHKLECKIEFKEDTDDQDRLYDSSYQNISYIILKFNKKKGIKHFDEFCVDVINRIDEERYHESELQNNNNNLHYDIPKRRSMGLTPPTNNRRKQKQKKKRKKKKKKKKKSVHSVVVIETDNDDDIDIQMNNNNNNNNNIGPTPKSFMTPPNHIHIDANNDDDDVDIISPIATRSVKKKRRRRARRRKKSKINNNNDLKRKGHVVDTEDVSNGDMNDLQRKGHVVDNDVDDDLDGKKKKTKIDDKRRLALLSGRSCDVDLTKDSSSDDEYHINIGDYIKFRTNVNSNSSEHNWEYGEIVKVLSATSFDIKILGDFGDGDPHEVMFINLNDCAWELLIGNEKDTVLQRHILAQAKKTKQVVINDDIEKDIDGTGNKMDVDNDNGDNDAGNDNEIDTDQQMNDKDDNKDDNDIDIDIDQNEKDKLSHPHITNTPATAISEKGKGIHMRSVMKLTLPSASTNDKSNDKPKILPSSSENVKDLNSKDIDNKVDNQKQTKNDAINDILDQNVDEIDVDNNKQNDDDNKDDNDLTNNKQQNDINKDQNDNYSDNNNDAKPQNVDAIDRNNQTIQDMDDNNNKEPQDVDAIDTNNHNQNQIPNMDHMDDMIDIIASSQQPNKENSVDITDINIDNQNNLINDNKEDDNENAVISETDENEMEQNIETTIPAIPSIQSLIEFEETITRTLKPLTVLNQNVNKFKTPIQSRHNMMPNTITKQRKKRTTTSRQKKIKSRPRMPLILKNAQKILNNNNNDQISDNEDEYQLKLKKNKLKKQQLIGADFDDQISTPNTTVNNINKYNKENIKPNDNDNNNNNNNHADGDDGDNDDGDDDINMIDKNKHTLVQQRMNPKNPNVLYTKTNQLQRNRYKQQHNNNNNNNRASNQPLTDRHQMYDDYDDNINRNHPLNAHASQPHSPLYQQQHQHQHQDQGHQHPHQHRQTKKRKYYQIDDDNDRYINRIAPAPPKKKQRMQNVHHHQRQQQRQLFDEYDEDDYYYNRDIRIDVNEVKDTVIGEFKKIFTELFRDKLVELKNDNDEFATFLKEKVKETTNAQNEYHKKMKAIQNDVFTKLRNDVLKKWKSHVMDVFEQLDEHSIKIQDVLQNYNDNNNNNNNNRNINPRSHRSENILNTISSLYQKNKH